MVTSERFIGDKFDPYVEVPGVVWIADWDSRTTNSGPLCAFSTLADAVNSFDALGPIQVYTNWTNDSPPLGIQRWRPLGIDDHGDEGLIEVTDRWSTPRVTRLEIIPRKADQ